MLPELSFTKDLTLRMVKSVQRIFSDKRNKEDFYCAPWRLLET